MQRRRIGSLEVSVAGLGCIDFGWRIDAADTVKVVDAALDAGINFFDTADIYGKGQSEEFLGRALGRRRDGVLIATKFGLEMGPERKGAQPAYVQGAAEASLRRLGTDRIDLYQLHRPDPATPISDTLGALQDLVRQGKVREIGCSNFSVKQMREARGRPDPREFRQRAERTQPDPSRRVGRCSARMHGARAGFSALFPARERPAHRKYRRGQEPPAGTRGSDQWGPEVFTDKNLKLVEKLIVFAQSRNQTLLDLAFAWLLAQPSVASVIAGARRAEQVRDNVAAVGWQLTAADLSEIDEIVAA